MKSLVITRYGGPEVLQVREGPDPVPGRGQVRVRVQRAGVNFADISARVGLYPDAPKPPMVVGYEASGVVDELGAGVDSLKVGDRVMAMTHFGGQADTVIVDAALALRIPDDMPFDDAAAIPVNYLTAYHMLFHVHSLKPGATVLVHAAAGGVGQAVIQLSKLVDGVVLFGTASASKHDLLRQWGVQHPIDYRSEDYAAAVKKLTRGRGVDLVLDALGGPDWAKGYDLLAPAGHLIAFGWSNMVSGEKRSLLRLGSQFMKLKLFSPMGLMNHNRTVSGVNMGHLWSEAAMLSGHLLKIIGLYEERRLKPRVDQVFPLSEGAQAHRYIQERKNIGKVLLDTTR